MRSTKRLSTEETPLLVYRRVGAVGYVFAGVALAAFAALLSAVLVQIFVEDPEETMPTRERLALRVRSASPERILDPIFALGIVTFVCAMIWLDWRETGELNSWMLSVLLVLVVLAVGTLFGFGRMEQALEVVGIDFGGKD